MIFSFHKDLIKYVKFQDTIEIKKPTLIQSFEQLMLEYPQLYVFLAENGWEEASKTSFKLNDIYIIDTKELHTKVVESDVVFVGRDIPQGESAVFKIAAAAVIAAVNAMTANNPYVYAFAASLALGGVSELVMGQPQLPTFDSGTSTSATYTFSGIKNTTVIGTPIGIVYGTHRVGGHIINAYNDVIGEDTVGNSSWLRMQIGLCEGEISQVEPSSIEINGRRASAYPKSDIGVLLRYGDSAQLPPDSPVIVAEDATSTIVPNVRNFPIYQNGNTYDRHYSVEYTLETPATSVDIYMSAYWSIFWPVKFTVYWKEASDLGDYSNVSGPFWGPKPIYDNQDTVAIPPTISTVVFPATGMYKIKIVPLTSTNLDVYGCARPVTPPSIEGIPPLPEGAMSVLDPYVVKYVIHNSGVQNTDDHSAMEFFNKIENSISYNLQINNDPSGTVSVDSPGVVVTTSEIVDSIKVNLSAPVLYKSANGNLNETAVTVKIYWKLEGSSLYTEDDSTTATIKGKTKSEVEYSLMLPVAQAGIYDIKIVRVTESNEDNLLITDRVYLKDIVEIIQDKLIYPHTALLGISIKATEHISGGLPTVTSIVKGTKVSVPENYNSARRIMQGSYTGELKSTKEWTDNPVWCLYDLITNSRYGLKDYFKISDAKLGIMLANFYIMAQYCDERVLPSGEVVTDSTSIDFEAARPRFSLNLVIDQSKTAIEWLTAICATMRGSLYYTEGCIFLDIDRPNKPITQIFNMSNLNDFTETGSSIKQLPNAYEVQFNNYANDYDSDTILVEDPVYKLNQSAEEYKNTLQLVGVTSEEQAKALAKYTLNVSRLLTKTVTFKTSTYGLLSTVGDIVGVQHDTPLWGFGGRIKSYNPTTLEIEVYEDITVENGKTYAIQLVTSGIVSEELALESVPAGTYSTFTLTSTPSTAPTADDVYVLGEYTKVLKPFKIVSVARDKDEVVQLTCVEYDESVYSDDLTDLPITTAIPNYSQLNLTPDRSVKNVKAEPYIYTDSSGVLKTGATVYYTPPSNNLFWLGVTVFYGKGGVYSQAPIDTTGVVFIPEITEEGDYLFLCVSKYTDGTTQTINEVLDDTVNNPYYSLFITPYVDNTEFMKGITGLQLVGQANDTNFVGRDAKFTWRKPATINFNLNDYAVDTPLGVSTSDSWLKEYRVEIRTVAGTVLRTSIVYDEAYTYTYEQNYSDTSSLPTREFTAVVYAIDRLGRASNPVSLTVKNPAPSAVI